MDNRRRKNRIDIRTVLLIGLCVAFVFAILALGVELLGRLFIEDEPVIEEHVAQEPDDEDAWEKCYEGLAKNSYDLDCFEKSGSFITYTGSERASRGIDVSAHQGEIDWAAVAADGVEYAMIRVGYRGYTRGDTVLDELFYQNVGGARDNGIAVGIYFFSQAITKAEAVEEAELVLRAIEGLYITYPIIFDWEDIPQEARTDGMDPITLTDCAIAFCETIEAAGHTAGIYFNQTYGYQEYILPDLTDYVFWLAQYDSAPSFYYDFQMWQYTDAGSVNGIEGSVDLNLSFWQPDPA